MWGKRTKVSAGQEKVYVLFFYSISGKKDNKKHKGKSSTCRAKPTIMHNMKYECGFNATVPRNQAPFNTPPLPNTLYHSTP